MKGAAGAKARAPACRAPLPAARPYLPRPYRCLPRPYLRAPLQAGTYRALYRWLAWGCHSAYIVMCGLRSAALHNTARFAARGGGGTPRFVGLKFVCLWAFY
jgi:hypothetical protein